MPQLVLKTLLISGMALHLALACVTDVVSEQLPCTEQCPDDDSSGKCPPSCPACVCCHHTGVFSLAAEVKVVPVTIVGVVTDLRLVAPLAPAPSELLRPPIIAIA